MARNETPTTPPSNVSDRRNALGCNLFLMAILLLVIAVLVIWAFLRNPPTAPNPTGTAIPERVPN